MLIKNKNRSKSAESLRRKAKGPVKWQPVVENDRHCLFGSAVLFHRDFIGNL